MITEKTCELKNHPLYVDLQDCLILLETLNSLDPLRFNPDVNDFLRSFKQQIIDTMYIICRPITLAESDLHFELVLKEYSDLPDGRISDE